MITFLINLGLYTFMLTTCVASMTAATVFANRTNAHPMMRRIMEIVAFVLPIAILRTFFS